MFHYKHQMKIEENFPVILQINHRHARNAVQSNVKQQNEIGENWHLESDTLSLNPVCVNLTDVYLDKSFTLHFRKTESL